MSELSKGQILAEEVSGISNSGKPRRNQGQGLEYLATVLEKPRRSTLLNHPHLENPWKLEFSLTSFFEVILSAWKTWIFPWWVPTGFIGSSKTHLSALENHSGFQGSEKSWKIRALSWITSWVSLLRFHGNDSCNVRTEETPTELLAKFLNFQLCCLSCLLT